jgi:hypothetical protein
LSLGRVIDHNGLGAVAAIRQDDSLSDHLWSGRGLPSAALGLLRFFLVSLLLAEDRKRADVPLDYLEGSLDVFLVCRILTKYPECDSYDQVRPDILKGVTDLLEDGLSMFRVYLNHFSNKENSLK